MGSKINGLSAVSDATAVNNIQLLPLCDPATGISGKMTIAQARKAFSTFKVKYVATGAEGVTLTISALSGMEIISIAREGATMYEVSSAPDSVSFIWDGTNITLGLAVGGPERFLIQYKYPA